ncbi:MAG: anthranilate synthase component I family protein [Candidatus Omnitrophica bacterium]|nr:anthranilate synthase component I family protein [Candidatus Omnitrophota bacterium]
MRTLYERGEVVPFTREIPFRDPFRVYERFHGDGPTAFLDSPRFHPKTATHSYIALHPFDSADLSEAPPGGAFDWLREKFSPWRSSRSGKGALFTGGAVGFLNYDSAEGLFFLMRDVIAFDLRARKAFLVTNLLPRLDGSFAAAFRRARQSLDALEARLATPTEPESNGHFRYARLRSNLTRAGFERMVVRAKRYIRQGDIYQANLSQCFSFEWAGNPLRLYEKLRRRNPSPFAAYLDFGRLKVASASPERLIRLEGRSCETRPIAGTRPVGRTRRESRRLSRELLLNEKERAEHLMLIDLERNDLGRVSEYRSVRVDEMMTLEKYSHVFHIVSNVTGKLAAGKDAFDLLKAVFPGGTITGCPKIRCMEIIRELEPCGRGLYTGSIGYLGFNGDMDWNIVIRTLVLEGQRGRIQAGAGIVHDSVPRREYEETLHKAKALLEALGIHGKIAG